MKLVIAWVLLAGLSAAMVLAGEPATLPVAAPDGISAALWAKMKAIDHAAGQIEDLSANFEQRKITPLLKKPMVSIGTVRVKGSAMLWDTKTPEPTQMRVDDKQVTLYYPQEKTAEIYPIAGKLAELAASPVPRLAVLLEHFKIAPVSSRDLGEKEDADHEAFLLTPIDQTLREHVDHVVVLIDAKHAFILAMKLVDADGDITEIHFSNVMINTKLQEDRVQLTLPGDVKIVHPLENLGSQP